jgi:ubiquinone/menaquinone biosynthesis C-methylase UbiE
MHGSGLVSASNLIVRPGNWKFVTGFNFVIVNGMHLYSSLAEVCHIFYRQYFPHEKIAVRLDTILKRHKCRRIVFIGGLIYVAEILKRKGYDITFVDYTPEMIEEAKTVIKNVPIHLGDMRMLSLGGKYDAILAIGRSFTYMYNNQDALKTLRSFHRHLKPDGIIIIDNYEVGKIDKDNYFNGIIKTKSRNMAIKRISTIFQTRKKPAIYNWNCIYEKTVGSKQEKFHDKNHLLRGFAKDELEKLIAKSGLKFISHLQNFEKRSFISIAKR